MFLSDRIGGNIFDASKYIPTIGGNYYLVDTKTQPSLAGTNVPLHVESG